MTRLTDRVNLSEVKLSLKLPFLGEVSGTWEPDEHERVAAWEMYVELVTRIGVVELRSDEGFFSEALESLHTLFDVTRHILRQHGPVVAQPKGKGRFSFGFLAVTILNGAIRPVLSRWHPALEDYQSRRPADLSPVAWERAWEQRPALENALRDVHFTLTQYAEKLAEAAGVPSLTTPLSALPIAPSH